MSAVSKFRKRFTALIDAGASSSPVERTRHESFITARLACSLAALGVLPPYLAYRGLPDPWVAVAFGWLVLPMIAVVLLSRSGRFGAAQTLSLVSIIGLVVTITVGGGASGAALAWLMLLPLEAAMAAQTTHVLVGTAAALATTLVLVLADRWAVFAANGGSLVTDAAFVLPGIVYAALLALGIQRVGRLSRVREEAGEARYRVLADAVGDLVLRLDRFGVVLFAGKESQSLFGLAPLELAGRGLFERIHVADRPAFLTAVADAAASAGVVVTTLRLRKSVLPGEPGLCEEPAFAWMEMRMRRAAEIVVSEGEPGAIVAVARDVTRREEHERELETARAEAERHNAWKDRFLANVSHELRTPLNAIIGFAEMLASEQLAPREPAKQREYAQIIRTSGEHLLAVVNTILDMSKIEAGSFDILPEPFEVAPLIDACCDMVGLKAEQARVTLLRECSPLLPELVADKRACKQILINLLSNAVKFTHAEGCVTVGARPDGDDVVFYVNDTGIGIKPRDLPRVGDPFFQVHDSYDRQYEGTGLGLSVVRGLVGLHGGSIAIESAPDLGTSVSVRLPLDCRAIRRPARAVARIDAVHRQATPEPAPSGPTAVKKIA